MHTMWDTVEANAWSRGFDYENYLMLYRRVFPTGTPFRKEFYLSFCSLLDSIMTKDMENVQDHA